MYQTKESRTLNIFDAFKTIPILVAIDLLYSKIFVYFQKKIAYTMCPKEIQ